MWQFVYDWAAFIHTLVWVSKSHTNDDIYFFTMWMVNHKTHFLHWCTNKPEGTYICPTQQWLVILIIFFCQTLVRIHSHHTPTNNYNLPIIKELTNRLIKTHIPIEWFRPVMYVLCLGLVGKGYKDILLMCMRVDILQIPEPYCYYCYYWY